MDVPGTLSGGRVALGALGLAAVLLGCTDGSTSSPIDEERARIVGGMLSDPKDNAVLRVNAKGRGCTGTLIAPTVVLTALHCLSEFDLSARFICTSDGELAPGATGGDLGALFSADTVNVQWGVMLDGPTYPAKRLVGTNSKQVCQDDLALIVLQDPLDIGDAPLVALRFERPTKAGETTRALGYGGTVVPEEPGRKDRGGISIRGVGASTPGGTGDPGVAPRIISVGEGPCQGDSGGPLLSEDTGAQAGVYSLLISESCKSPDARNSYTQVAPFAALITEVVEDEGYEPIVEPQLPSGTAGAPSAGGTTAMAGEAGEGGASTGTGGDTVAGGSDGAVGGAGGTGAVGGSSGGKGGGSSAAGGTGGTAGTDETGGSNGTGSGSRRDPSCTCRTAGSSEQVPWSLAALLAGAVGLVRRRRSRGFAR